MILQKYDFSRRTDNHPSRVGLFVILQKYDFSRQDFNRDVQRMLFVILQKYDFSSKSQHFLVNLGRLFVVCDTAKVRFFKQITTTILRTPARVRLFVILQKYDFSSKSQRVHRPSRTDTSCLWYCKSTIFQANHNWCQHGLLCCGVVCDTAKVRFFKQITTGRLRIYHLPKLFVILQKYDFSSKSQRKN